MNNQKFKRTPSARRGQVSTINTLAAILALVSALGLTTATVRASIEKRPTSDIKPAANISPDKKTATLKKQFGQIPLAFEVNEGQTDPAVKYLSRGPGYSLFLTPQEAVLSLTKFPQTNKNASQASKPTNSVLRMEFVGANADSNIMGSDRLTGKSRYYRGNNPKQWRSDVSQFKAVQYSQVYKGVDLVFYGNQTQLEYDFIVAPGTDPNIIQLSFKGAESAKLDATGNLLLSTAIDEVTQKKPVVYQDIHGKRVFIDSRYNIKAAQGKNYVVGFNVADYDHSKPLIIDPILSYYKELGGIGSQDFEGGVAADSDGNAVYAGWTSSSAFPVVNAVQPTMGGWIDAVVLKLDATGTNIVYSTFLGGALYSVNTPFGARYYGGYDYAYGIAVDSAGAAYITGKTSSRDFPVSVNAYDTSCGTDGICNQATSHVSDIFVTKLDASGNMVYSTFVGGSSQDIPSSIAVDQQGNAYITGWTDSTDYPTVNAYQATKAGYTDTFVTKLNATGTGLVYSTYLGGSVPGGTGGPFNHGIDIAVDSAGNAYVLSDTDSLLFPTTPGAYRTSGSSGGYQQFVLSKLNSTGDALVYSTYLPQEAPTPPGNTTATAVTVDNLGKAYVAGYTGLAYMKTLNPYQAVYGGGDNDIFLLKFSAAGDNLIFATFFGGNGNDIATDIVFDGKNSIYLSGRTSSTNFPTANPTQATRNATDSYTTTGIDGFVVKLSTNAVELPFSTYLGYIGSLSGYLPSVYGWGVDVDPAGNAYFAGGSGGLAVAAKISDIADPVGPHHDRPVVTIAPSFVSITLPVDSVVINAVAFDDGLPNPPGTLSLLWTATGPAPVSFSDGASTSTTASFTTPGNYILTLTANDGELSGSASMRVQVKPAPVNQAPVIYPMADATVVLPNTLTLNPTGSDDGLPNPPSAITFTWSQLSGPNPVSFSSANTRVTTVSFTTPGSYSLQLTASDSELSTSATQNVTVVAANQPPVVNAGPDKSVKSIPGSTTLKGSAIDDGLPNPPAALTYRWSLVSGPDSAVFSNANAATTKVSFTDAGTYVFRLTANDGALNGSDDVVVKVSGGTGGGSTVDVKGTISSLGAGLFIVAGQTIRYDGATTFQFEDGTGGVLAVGQTVQLKGTSNSDGSITATAVEVSP